MLRASRSPRLILGGTLTDLGVGSEVVFEGKNDALVGFVLFGDETAESDAPWAWAFERAKAGDQLTAVTRDEVERILLAERSPTVWRDVRLPSSSEVVASDAALERIGVPVPEDEQSRYPRAWVAKPWRGVPPFGGRVVHVPAERVGPRESYPLAEILARRGDFGASGEYAWSYLIIAGFTFDRAGDAATRRYRATNVGFGLSYVLPVVLGLLAPPGTLCLIENPEAHLHPRGQTRLAELAVRAARAGVQVVVETHSDHFIDGVRIAVRDGLIAPDETTFHYFERQQDGRATVSSPAATPTDGCRTGLPVSSISTRTTSRACSHRSLEPGGQTCAR